MKQLLFLLLFPCLAMAQYQGNGNQKITLGEQTSADGLVYRGVASIDTVTATSKITRANKQDTSAYLLLDTVTNLLWHYKISSNAWTQAGGGGGLDSTAIAYVNTYGTQTVRGYKIFNDSIQIRNIVISNGNLSNNSNLAVGFQSLFSNTPTGGNNGTANTAIGFESMRANTTGFMNVGLGYRALRANTTGTFNMAVGMDAMLSNTTGSQNVALGRLSLNTNTTSSNNVAIGYAALNSSTGLGNTAVGSLTLFENTTGTQNTALGYFAGWNSGTNANITGSNNTFIGNGSVNTGSSISNVITLGNSSIATIRAQVTTITSLSDIRDKTEIIPLNYGMNFIDKLKPVSFVWDMRDGGKIGIPEIGFIAQDLQQAQIDTGINIPNLVSGVDEKLEASYGVLLPIIVKALQEANEKIKSLEERIINLENK